MFNIKRFDPSQPAASPSTPTGGSTDALSSLAQKIEERRRKRKAGEAGLENDVPQPSSALSPPPPAAEAAPVTTAEWQPAPGESPAEREKRIKREKRAQKGGVSFDLAPRGPSGSSYVPPPPPSESSRMEVESGVGMGAGGIHPDRLGAPALAKEAKTGEPKEKTPARARYLKKKKNRAKGKKAGEPLAKPKRLKKARVAKPVDGAGSDGDSDGSSSEDEEERKGVEEAKRKEVLRKKEERKVKREAKKAEIRKLKAEGAEVPAAKPRVLPSSAPKVTTIVQPEPVVEEEPVSTEPTAEELQAAVEEEQRLARKEAKRLKRSTRRLSPAPPSPSTLIPTQVVAARSPSPIPDIEPIPQPEEPAPLLRLPSATRPAPPSAKTLSLLNVHASVRNKLVVDPEIKVKIDDPVLGLSERGRKRLGEMGIVEAFAVQTSVLPILLGQANSNLLLYSPFSPPQDVCVSAPTGSGKTLSYVVPIIETLHHRVVTRLRAIVLLPTRDLVAQVRETFEAFGKGTGLKIGTATGQHSFAHEQVALVGEGPFDTLEGGSSQIDILIATPGRLMDHIRATQGFSLQHLRYIVIDEADRLLGQSFHDWLPSILAALKPPAVKIAHLSETTGALAPDWWDAEIGRVASDVDERCLPSCQKLLFSATLSRDPAKIDALHLHRPIYVSVEDALDGNYEDEQVDDELKFTLPATLQEYMIVSPSTHKPLYLFHLLHTLSLSSALCFTKSVEAATRLAKLVDLFEDERAAANPDATKVVVHTYSSDLAPSERNRVLASFKKGDIQMLICSDLIARGIDLPDVSHVISYDIPTDMRKYVHRVGRTARAGKAGDAWSLVEDQEAAPFKAIMKGAQHDKKISRVRVKDSLVEPFVPHYQAALEKLRLHFTSGRKETS